LCFKFELMTVITVVEYLSVQAREPSRAGSRAYIEPSRASSSSSRSDRAEPGSARYSTELHRAEPSLARLAIPPRFTEPSRAWLGSAHFQPYLQPLPINHTHRPIILNQIYLFCEWLDSNSQHLSRTYPTLPLYYYINCVYITFSFLVYYNKPRVI
jgi:hypothetical protein